MSLMPYARKPGPRILMTHAAEDSVVPFASARNFAEAYRAAGGDVTLFAYSAKDEPNLGGHCIWPEGVKPVRARLLTLIEKAVAGFMARDAMTGRDSRTFTGERASRPFGGVTGWPVQNGQDARSPGGDALAEDGRARTPLTGVTINPRGFCSTSPCRLRSAIIFRGGE